MPILCAVPLQSGCVFYKIRLLNYNTYAASLIKDKSVGQETPLSLTIKKNGAVWESDARNDQLTSELGSAIEANVDNELYEYMY